MGLGSARLQLVAYDFRRTKICLQTGCTANGLFGPFAKRALFYGSCKPRKGCVSGLRMRPDRDRGNYILDCSIVITATQSVLQNAIFLLLIQIAIEDVRSLMDSEKSSCTMDAYISTYVIKAMSRIILGFTEMDNQSAWEDIKEITEISRKNFTDAKTLMSVPSCLWGILPAWWRHSARWDKLLGITRRYIQSVLDNSVDQNSVLGDLLQSSALTLDEIHLNVTDLILASVDTTTSTLLWLLHELSLHPEIQQRLRTELDDVTDSDGKVSYFSLQQLPYLRAVMRESLRLHPVGFFVSRVTQTKTIVHGFTLQQGIHVACSMYTAGRDKSLFPNPDEFQPERWMTKNSDLETFYGSVPFGFGKRMCVGRKVAELVNMVFIYQFCKTASFTSSDKCPIEPTFRILMVPSKPVTLNFLSLS